MLFFAAARPALEHLVASQSALHASSVASTVSDHGLLIIGGVLGVAFVAKIALDVWAASPEKNEPESQTLGEVVSAKSSMPTSAGPGRSKPRGPASR